jgi:ABC-type nitrate/sulfonate/bicarbonate transport system permease component
MKTALPLLTQLGAASCLASSGVIHAQLYLHGYRMLPGVGPAFLLQASGALAVALLLALNTAAVLRLAAAGLAAGALAGFIASRTIGVFGFVEYGFHPAPQALLSIVVEIAALALLAVALGPGPDKKIMNTRYPTEERLRWRA